MSTKPPELFQLGMGLDRIRCALLDAMVQPSAARGPVISAPLCARLREYLEFRHVFRQAYSFQLRWDKMSALVLDCEKAMQCLEAELAAFTQSDRKTIHGAEQ